MDSRDPSIQSRQQAQGMVLTAPYAFAPHLSSNAVMMGGADSGSNLMTNPSFPFNSISPPKPFDAAGLMGHHHQQQHYHPQQQNGSPASGVSGAPAALGAEQGKRKRGRPRKHSPDGNGLVLSSNSQVAAGGGGQKELGEVNVEGSQGKRQRGRPPGSGKKQLDALGGAGGVGFTPHVIMISPDEDIVAKVVEFSQEGPRTICILSANGSVCSVSFRQPGASDGSGIASYEGSFEIISLSGSFCCADNDGNRNNTVKLTVILATPDGKILGGGIAGELIAATDVRIIVGSFITDRKKSNASSVPDPLPQPTPAPQMLSFGVSPTPNCAPQLDAASDSSDNNGGSGSHSLNHTPGPYNNHPMHGMQQMYQPHMGWGNPGMGGMHHNQ